MADRTPNLGPTSTPPNPDVYAIYCGTINEENIKKLLGCLTAATVKGQGVHLLFQSSGGMVGDGICLHNFFRSLPVELTIYNAGNVSSIAVVAYLGAKRRIASPRSMFMIHRTNTSFSGVPGMVLEGVTKSVNLDDARSESILKESVKLPTGQSWSDLDRYDFYFSGKEAIEIGLAHEIGEFSPPPRTPVYQFF